MQAQKTSTGARAPKRQALSSRGRASTLALVREGVRRFILNEASIGDFHRALRVAARKGELSPNPLTGAVFRKIVKEAIDEQKRRTGGELLRRERDRQQ